MSFGHIFYILSFKYTKGPDCLKQRNRKNYKSATLKVIKSSDCLKKMGGLAHDQALFVDEPNRKQ